MAEPQPRTLEYQSFDKPPATSRAAWASAIAAASAFPLCYLGLSWSSHYLLAAAAALGALGLILAVVVSAQVIRGRKIGGLPAVLSGFSMVAALLLFPFIVIVGMLMTSIPTKPPSCAANLRAIAVAISLYADEDPNRDIPPNFETLFAKGDLLADEFVCPSSPSAAPAPPPFVMGKSLSYVYLGERVTFAPNSTTPVAYCQTHNHTGGTNILYADGSVRFAAPADYPPEVQPTVLNP